MVRDLVELHALDSSGELTSLGRIPASLPIEPLGKMMTMGCSFRKFNGFPVFCSLSTECLMTQPLNSTGPDNNLDVVISLLAFGVYPNVCYHKEERKIRTAEGHYVLSHTSQTADRTGSVSRLSSCLENLGLMLGISTGVIQNCGEASLLLQLSQNFSLLLPSDQTESPPQRGCLCAVMEVLTVKAAKNLEIIWQLDPPDEQMWNVIYQIPRPPAAGIKLMAANGSHTLFVSPLFGSASTCEQL
ncbi:ATP-dependent RNA helicase A [Meleagris gallopavo]|uniref:ATP-dependent RNA helicase A n=1 Tax=Meleagris gallopavo TaxID=9103 RepID=UPI0012AC24B1|nr:ATP-dependent RNA helicase A [Meleagris gallopavo]